MFNKNFWNWKTIVVTIWIILSVLYIWFDIFNKFVIWMYQNWYATAVNSLIEQASNKECKSFTVYNDKNKVELVNVACLQKAQEQANPQK